MLIQDLELLKSWLTKTLSKKCEADPVALGKYVIALVKKDKPLEDLKNFCLEQLDVFLNQETKPFVELLFETLLTNSYLCEGEPSSAAKVPNKILGTEPDNHLEKNNVYSQSGNSVDQRTDVQNIRKPDDKERVSDPSKENTDVSNRKELKEVSEGTQNVVGTSPYADCIPSSHPTALLSPPRIGLQSEIASYNNVDYQNGKRKYPSKRCIDYDQKGYCMRGNFCEFDHGLDPILVERQVVDNSHPPRFGEPLPMTNSIPPPLTMPPPPLGLLPPLPVEYVPEPYNPEAPGMKNYSYYQPTSQVNSYLEPPNSYLGSAIVNQPYPKPHTPQRRVRELVGVPIVEKDADLSSQTESMNSEAVKNEQLPDLRSSIKGRNVAFNYGRLGRKPYADKKILELRKIPIHLNTVYLLSKHFSKFGNIVDLQVCYNGDKDAALVDFSTPAEANAAYRSTEPVLNNRFIKIFYHNKDNERENKTVPSEVSKVPPAPTRSKSPEAFQTTIVNNIEKRPRTVLKQNSYSYGANSSQFIPPAKRLKKEDTKDATKKKIELLKTKQAFLDSQLANQRFILEKLTSSTKSEKEKEFLKKTLKVMTESITKLHQDIKSESESLKNLLEKRSTDIVTSKDEAMKQILDAEMELYRKEHTGEDTIDLLSKVNALKQKAKAMGIHHVFKKNPLGPAIFSQRSKNNRHSLDNRTKLVQPMGAKVVTTEVKLQEETPMDTKEDHSTDIQMTDAIEDSETALVAEVDNDEDEEDTEDHRSWRH